jgi:hypothetical protein
MTKKEKVIELNSKPKKITDEQLEKLQKTVNSANRGTLEVGSIELRKHELMHNIAGLRDEIKLLQDKFVEEYGTFDIDLQTGEINYESNGETN